MNRHSRLKQAQRRLTLEALENRSLMAADVTAGLIHKYTFDETSGDFAHDSIGTNTGSLANWTEEESKWVAGAIGGGLRFDGVDDLVITSSNISLSQYTVSFWLNRQGNGGTNPRIATPQGPNVPNVIWNREISKGIGVNTDGGNAIDSVQPPANVWTHYVAEVNTVGGQGKVYRNGNLVALATIGANAPNALWLLGHDQDVANHDNSLNGILDDLRIYNRLLSDSEVVTLSNFGTEPVVTASGTVEYTENDPGVQLAASATVTDTNSSNFAGGSLIVTIPSATAGDRVFIQSNGIGAGEINVTGNTSLFHVLYGNVEIGTFSGAESSSLNISLNAAATPAAVQALIRQVFFRIEGDDPGTNFRQVQFIVDDGTAAGASAPATITVNVTPTNDAPVVAGLGGPRTYIENAAAITLAPLGTVSDVDNVTFAGGTLTATVTPATVSADDRLSIFSTGTGPGQINVTGDVDLFHVSFGGTEIGTFSGAEGSSLTVALNPSATLAAVQALLRSVRFRVEGDNPATNQRQVEFVAEDGAGGTSTAASVAVNVTAANDAPVLAAINSTVNYTENAAGVALAPLGTVSDVDSTDFAGGSFTIRVTPATVTANDHVFIQANGADAGQISITGNSTLFSVNFGGTEIGTYSGDESSSLTIALNGNATPAAVQALLRQIYFHAIGDEVGASTRQVEFVLNDGDGGTSAPANVSVNVIAVDDAPSLGGIGGAVDYTEDASAVAIAALGTVSDIDNAHFATGSLNATVTTGTAADRISILSDGVGPGQISVIGDVNLFHVRFGGVEIGTFSGNPGSALTIDLNSNATPAAVQALVRHLRFHVEGNNPATTQRQIEIQLDDGAGQLSNVASVAVNVTAVNDAPVVAGIGSSTFVEKTGGVYIAGSATVSDVDSATFPLGVLDVFITAASRKTGDEILIASGGQIGVTAGTAKSTVTFGGTAIGTFNTAAGSSLQVALNASATPAAVQALLRQVYFRNTSVNPATSVRQFGVVLNDGSASSAVVAGTIHVTAVADDPVLGGISGAIPYRLNSAARTIAGKATVTDVDTKIFAGGKLTVAISRGADASNRIVLGGTLFTLSGRTIKRDGVIIGTLNRNGGVGRTNFEVTFNDKATGSYVQQLIRSLRFRTVNSALHVDRKLNFSLTDGDGGKSANHFVTMDVF